MTGRRIAAPVWYCLVVLFAVGILWLLFNFLQDASRQVGSDNLLEPATGHSSAQGGLSWKDPQSFVGLIFLGLSLASALLAIWRFRKNRLLALIAGLLGALILLGLLLPWSPLHLSPTGEGVGAQQAAPPQNLFSPLKLAMFFTWVLALLGLAMLIKERRWARLLYTLLWLLFLPLFLPQLLPSFCSRPQPTPEIAEAVAQGRAAREAGAGEDGGDLPKFLENVDLLPDATAPGSGTIELENGLQLDQVGGVSGVGLGVKGPVSLSQEPVFKVGGAEGIEYLRLVVGETYTGSGWLRPEERAQRVAAGAELPLPPIRTAKAYTTAQVTVVPILPLGRGPVSISLYTTRPEGAREFNFGPYGHELASSDELKNGYKWQGLVPVLKPEEVKKARTVVVSGPLLRLPDSLPQRVKDLAREITRGKATEYDKLAAIRQYLRANYTYDLDNAAAPAGWDAVDFFLFQDKRGVCTSFSSAFVVLARAVGIPARVVGGWAIAPTGAEQIVRAFQGHQWAEVPFEGLGWVSFEATPGGAPSRIAGPAPAPVPAPAATPAPTPQPTATPRPTRTPVPLRLVPTQTEITSIPPRLRKGEPAIVEGTVVARTGAIVGADGQTPTTVEIFINKEKAEGGTLVGAREVKQGEFRVEITVPQDLPPGNYQVMAHTVGNSVFAESWSDPQVEVYSGTHLRLVGPAEALVGEPVSITGQVLQESGQPVAEGKVEVTVEGQRLTLAPGKDGGFKFSHRFQKPGLQTIVARFTGTKLLLEKSAELQLSVMLPAQLSLDWPRQLSLGQRLTLNGELRDGESKPIGGAQVRLEVARQEAAPSPPMGVTTISTDRNGAFIWEGLFDQPGRYNLKADFSGSGMYAPASALGEVTVKKTTSLKASFPEKAKEGASFTVSARLVEEVEPTGSASGGPVPGARIEAISPLPPPLPREEYRGVEAITGPSGVATIKLDVPEKIEGQTFAAELRFNGDSQRWPASLSLAVPVGQGPSLLWISFISLAILAGLAGAFGSGFLLWRRWRHPPASEGTPAAAALDAGAVPEPALSLSKGGRSEAQQEPVVAQEPPQPSTRATYLTIDFPQITAPFPQIWGLAESLTIAGQLIDEAGPPVVQVNLRLASRGAGAVRQMPLLLASDADGRYQAQVSFTKKGDYYITTHYDGSPGLLPAEASRAILIVDYREEIVRLYNTFVSGVRDRSSLIPEDATPREVEGIMVSRQLVHSAGSGQALDEIALDEFISAFEEADYSLHPIERSHYERAYRAYHVLTIGFIVPSVLDMEGEPGGEARNSIEPEVDANKPASTNP